MDGRYLTALYALYFVAGIFYRINLWSDYIISEPLAYPLDAVFGLIVEYYLFKLFEFAHMPVEFGISRASPNFYKSLSARSSMWGLDVPVRTSPPL